MNLYSKYQVDIVNEHFVVDGNKQLPRTAIVRYYDKDGDEIFEAKYGVVDPEYIYDKIDKKEAIYIANCYVKDFSLNDYRKSRQYEARSKVDISSFEASSSFFDSTSVIDFSFANFKGKADLSKITFGKGQVYFYKSIFDKGVDFSETYFGKGDADFQFAEFGNNDVLFEKAVFSFGYVSFVNANFGDGTASFKNVDFGEGKVEFHFSKFGKGLKTFDRSIFGGGEVDFRRVEFGDGKVDFKRVMFGNGNVYFEDSEFSNGKISFKSSQFGTGDVSFEGVDFGAGEVIFDKVNFGSGHVSFFNTKSEILSLKDCELNNHIDLRVQQADLLNLTDTIVRDIVEIKKLSPTSYINQVNFSGMRNLGQIYIDWVENNVYELIKSQKEKTNNRQKADQFRILKENFHNLGQYDDEDYAYVEFKRHELKAKKEEAIAKNPANAAWVYPRTAFEWFVFDRIGLYATDPVRVLASTVLIYTTFSLFYYVGHFFVESPIIQSVSHPGPDNELSQLEASFYHSAVTFLTIGYGDYFPSGIFRFISAMEGWVGVFLMSYFTVAFVRKILR